VLFTHSFSLAFLKEGRRMPRGLAGIGAVAMTTRARGVYIPGYESSRKIGQWGCSSMGYVNTRDGELVFFCGAGVSKPAGLPLFGELVSAIYECVHAEMTELEKKAFETGEYDRVLTLLERRVDVILVRSVIATLFDREFNGNLKVHQDLLRLSRTQAGSHRLVTTNLDNLFHRAGAADNHIDAAPRLWPDLLMAIKGPSLDMLAQSSTLGSEYGTQLRLLFTFACLEMPHGFSDAEVRSSLGALSADELADVVWALGAHLEHAADRAEEQWARRVCPFINRYWPQDNAHRSPAVSAAFSDLVLKTGNEFPSAVAATNNFLRRMARTMVCEKYWIPSWSPDQNSEQIEGFNT
jgi:hypothetical protein